MKRFLIILLSLLPLYGISSQLPAPEGYRIQIEIRGLQESTLYLAYHLGNRQYIRDSLSLDGKGPATFSGDEKLDQGVYLLVLPGNRYFEFLVSDNQIFSISCDYDKLPGSITYEGSPENTAFADFQQGWSALHQRTQELHSRLSANGHITDSLNLLNEALSDLDMEMKNYMRDAAEKNSGNYAGTLIRAMMPLEVPEFDIPPTAGNANSLRWVMTYNYNKDHYFDNFDPGDERLLRSPLYHGKLETFFSRIVLQYPDSLIAQIDRVISMTEANRPTFQYLSVYLFNHFRESQLMGHDAIIVKLADDIYLSGRADWVSADFVEGLRRDVDRIRPSLIGNKGFNLVMDSYRNGVVSLDNINSDFLVLYFWEPDCGHCNQATPLLRDFYEQNKGKGIEVLSICTSPDKKAWEDYIVKNELKWIDGWDPERLSHYDFFYNIRSTPTIFILDRDKKIIAKKLPVEDVGSFIESYRLYGR